MEPVIEDCYDCGVYSYSRPTSHSKSARFLRGDGPFVTEWAFVLRGGDCGGVWWWELGNAVAGFKSRADAVRAGVDAVIVRELNKRP